MKLANNQYHYSFNCVNKSDFDLFLTYQTTTRLFKMMFSKTMQKLAKKHNMKIDFDPDDPRTNKFSIPQQFKKVMFPQIQVGIKKHLKHVYKVVAKDGYKILSSNIKEVIFEKIKEKEKYNILIQIRGQYVKK